MMNKAMACVFLLLSTMLVRAGSITETITIPAEDAKLSALGAYRLAWVKNGLYPSDVAPGLPKLPCIVANVLLPPGAKATDVVVECDDVTLDTGVTLYPVQPARTSNQMSTGAFVPPSPQIYAQMAPYPAGRATLTGTHNMRGQSIAAVLLHPFLYIPLRGEVLVARQMKLTVQYADPAPVVTSIGDEPAFMPTDHAFDDSVAVLVLNPSALKTYSPSNGTPRILGGSPCDYLIITKGADMIAAFWSLALYRATNDGFRVQVRDVDGIGAMYPGRDKQECIRNCIKDYVASRGTTYVVLGGDDTLVPDRDTWARVWMSTSTGPVWCVDASIPADAYYSNLDGTWDSNSNKVYGELADDVDFGVDVCVGRIPVRTAAQTSNYVDKLVRYEKELVGYSGRLFMGGVAMFDTYVGTNHPSDALSDGHSDFQGHLPVSDVEMWGRRLYRDWIQNTGYLPSRLGLYYDTVTSRDVTRAGEYAVNGTSLTSLMNEGWFHMFYLGHGYPSGIAVESAPSFNVAALAACQNPPVGVFVSGTCLAGAFDDTTVDPCFSEALLRQREGGALSYVGSSRYGWFTPDGPPASNTSEGGDSINFAQQFYKQVFTDKRSRLGIAFGNHKTALMGLATGDGGHRWLEYAINLQGDPALHLPDLTDIMPPTPEPSFAKPPEALSSSSIRLTASTASDPSGVEYQFVETFGRGIPASEWQTNPVYVLTGLNPDTLFTFEVRTRDCSTNHNLNDFSAEVSVKTLLADGEGTAPTPNPMTWATAPVALSPTSVTMTATTATDEDGVEYKFEEQTGHVGGNSSSWQSSTVYTDTGLSPNTEYRYRVRARDTSVNHNETTASIEATVTTPRVTLNDEWDPDDDAGTNATVLAAPQVNLQTHGPHTLSATDTSDWFQVYLTVGSSNVFHTEGGTGDNYGELFSDVDGTLLVASDDDTGGNRQFSLSYIATVTSSYYLRVRALTSGSACAYTLKWSGVPTDPNPPFPNPMRFASLPAASSPSNVVMSALAAEDASGVEYLFEETTGHAGGYSGAWQGSTDFANEGLEPDTTYGYRVRARDKSAAQNLTDWSEVVAIHTPPVVPNDTWDPTDDTGNGATDLGAPMAFEQTDGEHTLAGTDGEDWFHFYLEVGTTNTFWSTGTMGDPVAYLSDLPDGNHLHDWDDDSAGELQFKITFTPSFSGDYYLKVIPRLGSGPCIYTLHFLRSWRESDLTLAEALDTEVEMWGTSGDTNWVGTTAVSHDGQDAAVAAGLGDDQYASLSTTVDGPGTVGFWWRSSSELNYDFLTFAVDDVAIQAISGETDWTYMIHAVGAGSHNLCWTYAKDYSNSNGLDSAWVDQFSFTPEGQPPPMFRYGDAAWFAQSVYTHDGIGAEQSGQLGSNQWTRLQTFVEGPCTVSYWCSVSSEPIYDRLCVSVDGHTNLDLSGEQGWQCQTVTVWRPGAHDISWVYQKDESVDEGMDAAWVDEILWTPIPLNRDTDGDGQSDWQEGMAGVDPYDPQSIFRLEIPTGGFFDEDGGFIIEWQSATGVNYAVDYAESVTNTFIQIQSQIPGETPRTRYNCGNSGASMEFYRVRVDE